MAYFLIIKSLIAALIISLSTNTAFGGTPEIICSAPDRKPLERILGDSALYFMEDKVYIHDDRKVYLQGGLAREFKENNWDYMYPGCCRFIFQYLPDQKK